MNDESIDGESIVNSGYTKFSTELNRSTNTASNGKLNSKFHSKKNYNSVFSGDEIINSNDSIQIASRSFTTTDLLRWALQVTRGMQHLECRNILHGDLAARNILLCDNNMVKICDFGLARSVHKNGVYWKTGEV